MTIGYSGLDFSAGEVTEEWAQDIDTHEKRLKFAREIIDNSGVAGGVWYYMRTMLLLPEDVVQPQGLEGDPRREEAAEHLRQCLEDTSKPFRQIKADMLTAAPDGWSSSVITYKRRLGKRPGVDPLTGKPRSKSRHNDGRIGWADIDLRAQRSWTAWGHYDKDGKAARGFEPVTGRWDGWWQAQPSGADQFIPLGRTVHVRFDTSLDNPEGRLLFRSAKVPYHFVKRLQEYEAIGIFRDVGGTVVFRVPPSYLDENASSDQKALVAALLDFSQKISGNETRGGVMPGKTDEHGNETGFDIEILNSSQNLAAHATAIDRHEKRLAMAVMAHWIFMAIDGQGAYGAQKNSSQISGLAVRSMLRHWYDLMNRYLVRPLFEVNAWPEEFWPVLAHGDIDTPEFAAAATAAVQLVSAGLWRGGPKTGQWLRGLAGAPEEEQDIPTADRLREPVLPGEPEPRGV